MKLLAAALAALAFPTSAAAALEVRLSVVPTSPKKGAATVVQLRPYWTYNRPDGSCCVLKPADVRYPFRVEAVSPGGRIMRTWPLRRTKNRFVWAGRIVFRAIGPLDATRPAVGPALQPALRRAAANPSPGRALKRRLSVRPRRRGYRVRADPDRRRTGNRGSLVTETAGTMLWPARDPPRPRLSRHVFDRPAALHRES